MRDRLFAGIMVLMLASVLNADAQQRKPKTTAGKSAPPKSTTQSAVVGRFAPILLRPQTLPGLKPGTAAIVSGKLETDDAAAICDLKGAGVVTRLCLSRPAGTLRFYIDGEAKPRLQCAASDLFDGKVEPFGSWAAGNVSVYPIAFRNGCRIELSGAKGIAYSVQSRSQPADEPFASFTPKLNQAQADLRADIARDWSAPGNAETEVRGSTALEAGKTVMLKRLQATGIATALTLKIEPADRYTLRQTVLRIFWDGAKTPAIEVPLGDFFGTPFGDTRFKSLFLSSTDNGLVCNFPMPFRKEMRVDLANMGKTPLSKVDWKIGYTALKSLPQEWGYLNAHWTHTKTTPNAPMSLWNGIGRGHLAGTVLAIQAEEANADFLNNLNANIRFADEDTNMAMVSRLDAWFGLSEPVARDAKAFGQNGTTEVRLATGRIAAYRFFTADALVFQTSSMLGLALPVAADVAATVFWYDGRLTPLSASPVHPARLTVAPYRFKNALEAEQLKWTGGSPNKIDDRGFFGEASGGELMQIGAESTAEFTVDVEDVYTVNLAALPKRDGTLKYRYAFDGAPFDEIGEASMAALNAEESRLWVTSVPLRLTPGKHTVAFLPMDGKPLFLDYLDLMPSIKTAGVMEAESFLATAVASKPSTVERDDTQPEFSGNSLLYWSNVGENAELTVSVEVKEDGDYSLELGVVREAISPKLTIKWDGKDIGTADAFVSNRDIQPEPLHVGTIKGVTAGKHTLTLVAHAPRTETSSLNWDWLRLKKQNP
jgi:hypothetical protein